ncbi:MAG: hypothetical protein KBH07_13620, partial [Flavobacteriales bacterium]|nr:hypothetical protein [Flavobacteriales bacterium]
MARPTLAFHAGEEQEIPPCSTVCGAMWEPYTAIVRHTGVSDLGGPETMAGAATSPTIGC